MLEGLKVVEFATYVAGPGAAAVMADWGAEVIKVESAAGDPMRAFYPDTAEQPGNPVFSNDNRGKRGVVLDTGTAEGREALVRILADADVFITNLRPGALKRARLDYHSLKAELPRMIYCSVSGYGLDGAATDLPAFDITAFWAKGGVAGATIPSDVTPFNCRPGFGDHVTALAALSAVLAALRARDTTGQGRLVETSLIRAGVYAVGWDLSVQLRYGEVKTAQPRREAVSPLSGYFRTADGRWFSMVPRGANPWRPVALAVGRPDLAEDPQFCDPLWRTANVGVVLDILDEGFGKLTLAEVSARLTAGDVIWAPLQRPQDVVADPHAEAAGCFVEVQDRHGGSFRAPNTPVRFPGFDHGARRPAPGLGEHTAEVLAEAGYSPGEIERLRGLGAVT
ncbi:CaiB/BaiF CoA-transferase family protein [soil metagenome]